MPGSIITPGNLRNAASLRRVPFTHMGPADTRVWQACLNLNLFPADRFEYDVRLGGSVPIDAGVEPVHVAMWETLTKKRVDVLAWRGNTPWFVEVKPVAAFSALGQCLGYGFLGKQERPDLRALKLAVVCAVCDRDLKPCFEAFGISVVELPWEVAGVLLTPRRRARPETASE